MCVYLMEVLSIEFVHTVLTFQAIVNGIVLYGYFMCDYGVCKSIEQSNIAKVIRSDGGIYLCLIRRNHVP